MIKQNNSTAETGQGPALKRVLVGIDCSSNAEYRLSLAGQLASRLRAGLRVMFIEDDGLKRLASLPFSTEVLLSSGRTRTMESARICRALQAQVRCLRQTLKTQTEHLGIDWTLDVLQGRLLPASVAALRQHDILLLGGRRAPRSQSTSRRGPVAVVFDSSPRAMTNLATATHLAQVEERALMVLAAAGGADAALSFQRQANHWLQGQGLEASYQIFTPGTDLPSLINCAEHAGATIMVMDAEDKRLQQAGIQHMGRASCAFALVH